MKQLLVLAFVLGSLKVTNGASNEDEYVVGDFNDIAPTLDHISRQTHPKIAIYAPTKSPDMAPFDFTGGNVMLFMHMQKTGGRTFDKHLVDDLEQDGEPVCKKVVSKFSTVEPALDAPVKINKRGRVEKFRLCTRDLNEPYSRTYDNSWLISRRSSGWTCGVHADFTSMSECFFKKIYPADPYPRVHLITTLRQPSKRFISEWKHTRRGATWAEGALTCRGDDYREIYKDRWCFNNKTLYNQVADPDLPEDPKRLVYNVSLTDFTTCPYSLAVNRQTRMLAHLHHPNNVSGCYYEEIFPIPDLMDKSKKHSYEHQLYHLAMRQLLASAKKNLQYIFKYFGLVEYQRLSQYTFEYMYKVNFREPFVQEKTLSDTVVWNIPRQHRAMIKKYNYYDIQLYKFARRLFFERIRTLRNAEKNRNDVGS